MAKRKQTETTMLKPYPERKAPEKAPTVSVEIRHNMIAEAAYFRAEKRGFQNGDPIRDWLVAEEEIDEILAKPTYPSPSVVLVGWKD